MSRIFQLCALLLAFLLTPGAGEVVENAVHLVADGHTAHSIDDAEHAPAGDEHGCTGMMHSCACHGVPSVALCDAPVALAASARGLGLALPQPDGSAASGHGDRLDRPPAV
ncbi:MAG: hypothetical protein KUG77_23105 [Nannocystaceae bacterium]|nr:hypothetical protein [Nannocystaceae bacterium]